MNKFFKKVLAGVLAAAMVMAISVPAMADEAKPTVFVNFICGANSTGKTVTSGSNVTAPQVPLYDGHTFCGFDKSLYNITQNTTISAVYLPNSAGEEAIKAKKASLPTPAVTATTVADPNAAAQPAAAPAAAAKPADNKAADAGQQVALQALLQAQTAAAQIAAPVVQDAAKTAAPAVQAATQAAAPVVQAATQAAAPVVQEAAKTAAPAVQAAAQTAAPVIQAAGLPSWAVSLHGVDAAGCAEVYKYWKTVKNADDATIQGNWDALLNHYAGHGTVGW